VLNVVSGGDALGAWITEHPTVCKVSFTGSVATGKRVAAAAAPDLKRVWSSDVARAADIAGRLVCGTAWVN
jgi:acyl-CoA reductase-like NAD-dependent aldehyde dehydrogenase